MKNNKSGFTLVELMVVAVIVAILAAVAIPLMSANKIRAMVTEAEAGCGTLRSAFRALYAETGDYSVDLNGNAIIAATDVPGVSASDLDGRYFDGADYSLANVTATTYTIIAAKDLDGDLTNEEVRLDQDGNWTKVLP